jgi:hypothetical protein
MIDKTIGLPLLLLLAGALPLMAQTPEQPPDPRDPRPAWIRVNEEKRRDFERTLPPNPAKDGASAPHSYPRETRPDAPDEAAREIASEEYQAKYGVSPDHRKKYQSFLNQRDTGIIRIFPNKNCGGKVKTVTVAELERCADVPPVNDGGSIWSFRCNTENFNDCRRGQNVDLKYKNGMFLSGNGVVQGVMADIDGVELSTALAKHKAFKFLKNYDPGRSLPKIAERDKALAAGIAGGGGYVFSNRLPAKLNSTYILRSVLYRYHERGELVAAKLGIDVVVAFKVVEKEPDGSLIVIFLELDRQRPRRQLER